MTVGAAAPQHATGSGPRRWPGTEPPAAAGYLAGQCPQPGSLPPRAQVQDGRQADLLRDRGGKPDAKGDLGSAETPGEAGEGSPGPCQQVRRQGRREGHRRRGGRGRRPDGSQSRRRLRRRRRPPRGLAELGEAPKALQTQAAEPAAPTSFRRRTQQHRGCPVLLGDPGRHTSAQFHARRPWPEL